MRFLFIILALIPIHIFALPATGVIPGNGLFISNSWDMTRILSYGEEILLRVVLPLAVVGVTLYVGYHLLTAEGDEEKMKKAFKSLSYSAIGLIAVACAYVFVTLIGSLSF